MGCASVQELAAAGLVATPGVPPPPPPTPAALKGLPFLDAVVHESLRLYSPASGGGRVLAKVHSLTAPALPCAAGAALTLLASCARPGLRLEKFRNDVTLRKC